MSSWTTEHLELDGADGEDRDTASHGAEFTLEPTGRLTSKPTHYLHIEIAGKKAVIDTEGLIELQAWLNARALT